MGTYTLCDEKTLKRLTESMTGDLDCLPAIEAELARHPQDHRLYLIKGSVLAERGDPQAAQQAFNRALAITPGLSIARFLLGFSLLVEGASERAAQVWQPLDVLPASDPLRLFRDGLLFLAADEFEHARRSISAAVECNTEWPQLTSYFQVLRTGIDRAEKDNAVTDQALLLSGYQTPQTRH